MADGEKLNISRDPLKVGAAAGVVVVLIGAVVLDLGWVAYLALLGVVAVIGAMVVAVQHHGGDTDRTS